MVNLRSIQTSPSSSDHLFMEDFNKTFDKISVKYDIVILIGDLNYNVLDEDKGTPLTTMCDIFDYTNLEKTATCHTKNANPTQSGSHAQIPYLQQCKVKSRNQGT